MAGGLARVILVTVAVAASQVLDGVVVTGAGEGATGVVGAKVLVRVGVGEGVGGNTATEGAVAKAAISVSEDTTRVY